MSTHALAVLLWTLLILASVPLVYLLVLLWLNRKKRRSRAYALQARETYYGGTFLEPEIDFDELERTR